MFSNIQKIHFIGIGGAGMSGLAHVLNKQGKTVSGSDAKNSPVTERLQSEGINVFIGHSTGQVGDSEVVVLSTAISKDNVEYQEAVANNKKIVHRSDIMSYIVNSKQGIAVAGAHGKTTTTSMIAYISALSDLDPTYLVGGDVPLLSGNAHLGKGKFAITEADESDGSFLKLTPYIAIITNIEDDHMDYYKTKSNIDKAFAKFLDNVRPGGIAIVCFDNQDAREISQSSRTEVVSYAIEHDADFQAKNIVYAPKYTTYELFNLDNKIADITLSVPGEHNVLNSLAAIIACLNMGISLDSIKKALAQFTGAKRRFELKYKSDDLVIIDDYAHHPTEITTTLKAALQTNPQRLICVFQPHRYTRTQLLFKEFVSAFTAADILIITDIYAASEQPIANVHSQNLVEAIQKNHNLETIYIADLADIPAKLQTIYRTGDMIMTMGAGNVYTVADNLAAILEGETMKNKKIGVVLGGPSAEREVSLRTGSAIHKALLSRGYSAVIIDLDPSNFAKQLIDNNIDVVFNAVHGLYGEDGCMQGQLDMLGIKYTGSGVLASSAAMDKIISKRIFISAGISTPEFMIVAKKDIKLCIQEILNRFALPVVIKPPAQGSSVGVEIVKEQSDLERALTVAFKYSDELLIEEFINGRELTAAILKTDDNIQVLPLIEIAPHSGVYDYTSKYTVGATQYLVPAPIDDHLTSEIQAMAKQAFYLLGCKGVARADIMLNGNNAYILEVNTIPGMTETSLVPKAAAAVGMSFEDLCERILLSIK